MIVDQQNPHNYAALQGQTKFVFPDSNISRNDMTMIYMRFSGKPIKLHKKVLRFDTWTLLGSVGGSLGLFLGFSIYSTITSIQEFICKQI